MSEKTASLQSYIINGEAYSDARLDAGLIIEHTAQATMRIRKPNLVRTTNRTSEDIKELFFDSSILTVFTKSRNFYGQSELPGGAKAVPAELEFQVGKNINGSTALYVDSKVGLGSDRLTDWGMGLGLRFNY